MTAALAGRVPSGALGRVLLDAVAGSFPPVDGGVTVLPADETTGLEAVLSFTGHAVVATDLPASDVRATGIDAFASSHAPAVLQALAGPDGWIGVIDVMLVAPGTGAGAGTLVVTAEHDDHDRVGYARDTRTDVTVLADHRGLVTLGRGLAGRTELGFEVPAAAQGRGVGRALLADALGAVPAGAPVFAACAPGNAQSLRCLLAVGFRPLGGEVLLRPRRAPSS